MVETAANLAVLALRVFADDHQVDSSAARSERAGNAVEQAGWSQADVLIKASTNRDQEPPERDVVRHIGPTHGTEENCFGLGQLGQTIGSHHLPRLDVVVAAPGEVDPVKPETLRSRQRVEHLARRRHRLDPNPVSRNGRDAIAAVGVALSGSCSHRGSLSRASPGG